MTLEALVARTRERLAGRRRRVVPHGPLVRAAVLVPLLDRDGPCLVFAKRTERVGTHRGQISFPGEIEKVIEVPFAALVEPANARVERRERGGVVREVYFYDYGGETIWGATARIVKDYLDLVTGAP